jgi:hypothetical protein
VAVNGVTDFPNQLGVGEHISSVSNNGSASVPDIDIYQAMGDTYNWTYGNNGPPVLAWLDIHLLTSHPGTYAIPSGNAYAQVTDASNPSSPIVYGSEGTVSFMGDIDNDTLDGQFAFTVEGSGHDDHISGTFAQVNATSTNAGTGGNAGTGDTSTSNLTATVSAKLSTKPLVPGKHTSLAETVNVTDPTSSTVSGTVTGAMFLSTGVSIDSTSIQVASGHTKIKLKPHKHASISLSALKLPSTISAGTYNVIVRVTDPSGNAIDIPSSRTVTVS